MQAHTHAIAQARAILDMVKKEADELRIALRDPNKLAQHPELEVGIRQREQRIARAEILIASMQDVEE